MKRSLSYAAVLAILLLAPPSFAVNQSTAKFPLRGQYDVTIIETADLKQRFEEFVIVDVRSKYEYDTLRIRGARHVPLSDPDFTDAVRAVIKQNGGKPIAFYCNGTTCRKSYDAALRCENAGIGNTVVYDAGIHEWATSFPDLAVLLGRTPRPQDLISDAEFKKHLVSTTEFAQLVENNIGKDAIVLDIRDRIQRDTLLWPLRGEKRVPLDDHERIDRVIAQAKQEGKLLLAYDAAGHQIRWFQYYLKEKGVTNYRLMQGGAQAYFRNKYRAKPDSKVVAAPSPGAAAKGQLVPVKAPTRAR